MIERDGNVSSSNLDKKTLEALKQMRESGSRQISKEEAKDLKKSAQDFDLAAFIN